MSDVDITGRDDVMTAKALYFAIKAMERLPIELRVESELQDWKAILLTRHMEYARTFLVDDVRQYQDWSSQGDADARQRILEWLAPPDLFEDDMPL